MKQRGLFKFNKWIYLAISILAFLLGVLFVYLSTVLDNQAFLWISVIFFLVFSIAMQGFMTKIIGYKVRKETYTHKYYSYQSNLDIVAKLKSNNFTFKKNKFGTVAVKIIDTICYKVTIVENLKVYLDPNDKNKVDSTKTKGIEKCKELIGFEIFTKDEDDIFYKSGSLCFTGDKVFYDAFCLDEANNQIIESNVIEPGDHSYGYNYMKKMLEFEEIEAKEDIINTER